MLFVVEVVVKRAKQPMFMFCVALYAVAISLPVTGGVALFIPIFVHGLSLVFNMKTNDVGAAHVRLLARTSIAALAYVMAAGVLGGIGETMQEMTQDVKAVYDNALVVSIFVSGTLWYMVIAHGVMRLLGGKAPDLKVSMLGRIFGLVSPKPKAANTNP